MGEEKGWKSLSPPLPQCRLLGDVVKLQLPWNKGTRELREGATAARPSPWYLCRATGQGQFPRASWQGVQLEGKRESHSRACSRKSPWLHCSWALANVVKKPCLHVLWDELGQGVDMSPLSVH